MSSPILSYLSKMEFRLLLHLTGYKEPFKPEEVYVDGQQIEVDELSFYILFFGLHYWLYILEVPQPTAYNSIEEQAFNNRFYVSKKGRDAINNCEVGAANI